MYGRLDYIVLCCAVDCFGLINRKLEAQARKENAEAIMTMMSRCSASKYQLIKNGFIKSPFIFQLIVNNLTDMFDESRLLNERNWHLMWVDSDDL